MTASDENAVLPPADAIEDLVLRLLRMPEAAREGELAALCAQHPRHAEVLRRRYAFLAATGLLAAPAPSRRIAMPERIGGYRLLRRLGQGGMGIVWLAQQESLGRRVALKLIQSGIAAPARVRQRFQREVQAAALLEHPNICPVHDAGEHEGVPYLAMRYIEGETLAERIAAPDRGRFDTDAVVAMGIALARALHAAHEKGLVHRDVKPANIMLERGTGVPLLLDFGLAQLDDDESPTLTLSGDRIGTPAYMAPEQVAGRGADRRTDVYGLAATLYQCATGRVPHDAPTREALYRRILSGEIPRARRHDRRIPRDLDVVLATALERDPDRRYRTAAEFADDLQRLRDRQPVLARAPGPWLLGKRWCQRNPSAATALAVLVCALALALLLLDERSRALRGKDAALLVQRAMDLRGSNPEAALRLARDASQLESPPSTTAVAALRAALHAPRRLRSVVAGAALSHAFDVDRTGATVAWHDIRKGTFLWGGGDPTPMAAVPGYYNGHSLRVAPDGQRIAVAGNDGPVVVFARDGGILATCAPPPLGAGERVFTVAWHPSRDLLAFSTGAAAGDCNARVHLWDVAEDRVLWSPPVAAWSWHLQFVDEDHLAVAPGCARWSSQPGFDDHRVHVFPIDGGPSHSHDRHDQPCMEMAIHDGLIATVGHDRRLVLWRPFEGVEPAVVDHPDRVFTVDFAPDGQRLVTACADGMVRVFDRRGELQHGWRAHGALPVDSAVFTPSGREVLVRLRDRRLLLTIDGRELASLPATRFTVRTERFLADGRLVAFEKGGVGIWQLWNEQLATRAIRPDAVAVIAPGGEQALTIGSDGLAVLEDAQGRSIWSAAMPRAWPCVDDENRAYATTEDRRIVVVSPAGMPEPVADEPQDPDRVLFYLTCAPRGGLLAVSDAGETIRVVRRVDGVWTTVACAQMGQRRTLRMLPQWSRHADDSWRILAGTSRGVVEFAFRNEELQHHGVLLEDHAIDHVAVSPDGSRLAVDLGSQGTRLFVRDGDAWQRVAAIDLSAPILHLTFARDDRLLATGADVVRILDLDLRQVGQIPNIDAAGFVSAHALPGGTKVRTLAANHVLREWWLDDERVLDEAAREQRR